MVVEVEMSVVRTPAVSLGKLDLNLAPTNPFRIQVVKGIFYIPDSCGKQLFTHTAEVIIRWIIGQRLQNKTPLLDQWGKALSYSLYILK